jgi:hypothetical protein
LTGEKDAAAARGAADALRAAGEKVAEGAAAARAATVAAGATGREREVTLRVLEALARRGLAAREGTASGRDLLAAAAAPGAEALMAANRTQRGIVERACAVPSPGANQCAGWVCRVFETAGLRPRRCYAKAIYQQFCTCSGEDPLRVAMVVASPCNPYGRGGWDLGHVGLYVGDRVVMDCAGDKVRRVPLSAWLLAYGVSAEPRWGWLGGVPLA